MTFSLLIFSFNEIKGMQAVLPRIDRSVVDEVLVVDGGSTDGSIEFAKSLGFDVYVQKKKGLLAGFEEGMAAAKGDILIIFTPDNNMIPEKIPALVEKMKEGYDMVTVSRFLDGAKSLDDNTVTAFGNWFFTKLVRVLFGSNCTDSMGFYRAMRRDLMKELGLSMTRATPLNIEIRCAKKGLKVCEIPGDEPPRIGGNSSRYIIWNGLVVLSTILWEFVKRR
ncbi:MAG: glycosyltransferase family 2 protein [Thermodesulfobacteriota bacterium]